MVTKTPLLESSETPHGMGEPPIGAIAAAVANAVYDAVGVRIDEVPSRPDKVLAALDEVARRAGIGPLVRRPVERTGWHPGRTVVVELDGIELTLPLETVNHMED